MVQGFGRLVLLILGLAVLTVAAPLAVWGTELTERLSIDGAVAWIRGYGAWAWIAGMGLIVSDLVLPVPTTAVIAALGVVYGPLVGGLIGGVANFLAGIVAYGIARALGPRVARQLAGHEGLAQAGRLFRRWGGALVVISRWVPVLPETVALLAGLAHMPAGQFALALALGALPLGFTFATVGHFGAEAGLWVLVLAVAAPIGLWALLGPMLARHGERRRARREGNAPRAAGAEGEKDTGER